jgi:hypothetical protein
MYLTSNVLRICHSLCMVKVSQITILVLQSQFKETATVFVGDRSTQRIVVD